MYQTKIPLDVIVNCHYISWFSQFYGEPRHINNTTSWIYSFNVGTNLAEYQFSYHRDHAVFELNALYGLRDTAEFRVILPLELKKERKRRK